MITRAIVLLLVVVIITQSQYITNQSPPPPDQNPKWSPYWYKADCCPRIKLASSIEYYGKN